MKRLALLVSIAGCATVERETLVSSRPAQAERCETVELVASASPAEWPNVVIEVQEQKSCTTAVESTYDVSRELHVSPQLAAGIAGALGFALGLGLELVLISGSKGWTSYSYTTTTGGDALLLIPIVGAAVFSALVQGRDSSATEPLSHSLRVETRYEVRQAEGAPLDDELGGAAGALGPLRGGRLVLPLDEAMRVYGRPMRLGHRRVEWSVRRQAWVPGLLPSCERAARVWQAHDFERLSVLEIQRASDDAEACAADGWPFAHSMVYQLADVCRARFKSSCAYAH